MLLPRSQYWRTRLTTVVVALIAIASLLTLPAIALADTAHQDIYEYRDRHNPDGIGKFYMGREIAQVMGHQGAAWLERFSRQTEEQPERAIAALDLHPSDVVADIGAGTGYFSFRMGARLTDGKVYAVDLQPEMLALIEFVKQEESIVNVETILADQTHPNLPENSVDLAIMVDAYHEFENPKEMMLGVVKALKSDGRVVLLEYRGENPLIPIKGLHKMTERQVKQELNAVGLRWQETKTLLPQQHLMVFRKVS